MAVQRISFWGGYDMKSELTIQYGGKDNKESDLVAMAKDAFKAAGNKVSDITVV